MVLAGIAMGVVLASVLVIIFLNHKKKVDVFKVTENEIRSKHEEAVSRIRVEINNEIYAVERRIEEILSSQ